MRPYIRAVRSRTIIFCLALRSEVFTESELFTSATFKDDHFKDQHKMGSNDSGQTALSFKKKAV